MSAEFRGTSFLCRLRREPKKAFMSTISRVGGVRGRMCIHKLPQPGQAQDWVR